jgi:hypothetical protein
LLNIWHCTMRIGFPFLLSAHISCRHQKGRWVYSGYYFRGAHDQYEMVRRFKYHFGWMLCAVV